MDAAPTNEQVTQPPTGKKAITCDFWAAGNCCSTAETCEYSHSYTTAQKKKDITCFYWANGRKCRHSADKCEFAHHETGVTAGPPGTYNKGSSFASGASGVKESDLRLMAEATSPTVPFFVSLSEQIAGAINPDGTRDIPHHNIDAAVNPRPRRSSTIPSEPVLGASFAQPMGTAPNLAKSNDINSAADPRLNRSFTGIEALPSGAGSESNEMSLHHSPIAASAAYDQSYESEYAGRSNLVNDKSNSVADPRLQNRTSNEDIMPDAPAIYQRPTVEEPEAMTSYPMDVDSDDSGIWTRNSIETDYVLAKNGIEKLDFSDILLAKGNKIVENVYIHMPAERHGEVSLIRKSLKGCPTEVYFSTNLTQWGLVKKLGKSLLILIHPDDCVTESLPGLHKFLMEWGSSVRIFSIGVQYARCIREHCEPTYGVERLFPHGGITFITDDVFVYYPEKATEIIEKFLEETKNKPAGGELSKIGARPGVMDWISELASRKVEEQERKGEIVDTRWLACYNALCKLCPIEDYDTRYLPDRRVPTETSHLWSTNEDFLPSFIGRWESGDEEGATDYMANHFAGEAYCKAWKYRKFLFVYQRPEMETDEVMASQTEAQLQEAADPKGWMAKYNHIGVVSPDHVLKVKEKK